MQILTAGEILVEIMATRRGQRLDGPGNLVGPYPSGAPAIFIDQVALMGSEATIIARIGCDAFGRLNTSRLKKDGVNTDYIRSTPSHTTGTAFVTYAEDGTRSFIFHFTHSAAGVLQPEDIQPRLVKQADYLHIMGCSLTGSESMRDALLFAVERALDTGTMISFDPNLRPELYKKDAPLRQDLRKVLSRADILLSGRQELKDLTETSDATTFARRLISSGTRFVVLRNGSQGIEVFGPDASFRMDSFRVTEVDPTGAGDCFDGTFIACLAQGMATTQASLYASAAGAMSVTQKGPMEGNSTRQSIENFLRDTPRPRVEPITT